MKHNYTPYILSIALFLLLALPLQAQDAEHVRVSNLPHVYINTFTGRAITSKDTYVYATMWYVDEEDHVTQYDSLEIRGRGNSTWTLAKKPYRIKFHQKEKLLGTGYAKTKKWTLLANHADKTLIRNAVTSLMGERAGLKFNPAAKFVDLTLNGKYVGNYQISDAVDVRPHRVNITEQDLPLTDTSNITGGYLLEADGFKDFQWGVDGFYTWNKWVPIRIHYPDDEDIDSRQQNYIQQYVQHFEDLLYSDQFADPEAGYRPLVDSLSLAYWYICTELSGNIDGFFSTYFYKEQDDPRLYWGPLWDYDIAYNNDNRTDRGGTSNTLRQLMKDNGYGDLKQWMQRMWQDPWFASLIHHRFDQLVADGIEDYLNQQIDSLTDLLSQSVDLNYQRWSINTRTLRERVLYSTYDKYIDDLRSYINQRIPFLQQRFAALAPDDPTPTPPEPQPIEAPFDAHPNYYYSIHNVGSGTVIDIATNTDQAVGNARDASSESQQWQLLCLSSGYYHIVNRATGQALSDPTPGESTATTATGTQLAVAQADSTDSRQLWQLVDQGSDRYNLTNAHTDHTANLSGGSSQNGTAILSYTNDERNASSNNRMWQIVYADSIHSTAVGINAPDVPEADIDYALAYDPASCRLHFGADQLSQLTFAATVYDQQGRRLATFAATSDFSLAPYPRGLYIVSWTFAGRHHSVKVVR